MNDFFPLIDGLRNSLEGWPDAITFAELPPGYESEPDGTIPTRLRILLAASDGPRCGSIVIFSAAELQENQYYTDELDGDATTWLCFGLIDDDPLLLHRASGEVWWFPNGIDDRINGRLARLTNLDTFVTNYLFGHQYPQVTNGGENDRWYTFLQNHRTPL